MCFKSGTRQEAAMDLTFVVNHSVSFFLIEKQFKKRGNTFYKCSKNAFFAISFYSSGLCVYYVMPLFIPFQDKTLTYGGQLGIALSSTNGNKPDDEKIRIWANRFFEEYYSIVEPFFKALDAFIESDRRRFVYSKRVCTDIEMSRFLVYLFLYRRDLIHVKDELVNYENLLLHGGFFSERVVTMRKAEVEEVYDVVSKGEDCVKNYVEQIVLNTKKVLRI